MADRTKPESAIELPGHPHPRPGEPNTFNAGYLQGVWDERVRVASSAAPAPKCGRCGQTEEGGCMAIPCPIAARTSMTSMEEQLLDWYRAASPYATPGALKGALASRCSTAAASVEMLDSVRGVLQILRNTTGATFHEVRKHCQLRGDDMTKWPDWIMDAEGYVTEQSAARLLYEIMQRFEPPGEEPVEPPRNPENFRRELAMLMNRYSMENGSNTPDCLLADYLIESLRALDGVVNKRERWYGHKA